MSIEVSWIKHFELLTKSLDWVKSQANFYHLGCFDDNLRKSNLFLEINAKL